MKQVVLEYLPEKAADQFLGDNLFGNVILAEPASRPHGITALQGNKVSHGNAAHELHHHDAWRTVVQVRLGGQNVVGYLVFAQSHQICGLVAIINLFSHDLAQFPHHVIEIQPLGYVEKSQKTDNALDKIEVAPKPFGHAGTLHFDHYGSVGVTEDCIVPLSKRCRGERHFVKPTEHIVDRPTKFGNDPRHCNLRIKSLGAAL